MIKNKRMFVGLSACVGLLVGAQVPPPAFVTQEDAFEETCDGAFWHVQGIAISDDAVYCGLLKNIVKFDLATGKCLKGVPAPSHTAKKTYIQCVFYQHFSIKKLKK